MYLQFTAVYILLGWAFYVPMRAGLVFNGPVYIGAIVAYFATYAKLQWGWPFGLILLAGIGLGTLVGFAPARALARTRELALALATIAIIFIVQTVIRNTPALGATRGIYSIPPVSGMLPMLWVAVLIVGVLIYRIDHSRLGRAVEVMRTNPDIAGALGGVYPVRLSVLVQTISGAIAGVAASMYPFVTGSLAPTSFTIPMLLYIWTIVFTGGQHTMWGTLAFAPIIWGLQQIIPPQITGYTNFIFGGILIAVLVSRPQGAIDKKVISSIGKLLTRRGKRAILQ